MHDVVRVEDGYSRKILAYDLEPGETALVLSDVLELRLENARKEGHLLETDPRPKLYSRIKLHFYDICRVSFGSRDQTHLFPAVSSTGAR